MGIVLGIADRIERATDRTIKNITLRDAVLMGLAQALALIPGVSRSGATISMGRFLGYEREAATRYAFLLAIPAVVGAGLFELKEIPDGDNTYGWGRRSWRPWSPSSSGTPPSPGCCATSRTNSYLPFVIYRIALGVADAGPARRRRAAAPERL